MKENLERWEEAFLLSGHISFPTFIISLSHLSFPVSLIIFRHSFGWTHLMWTASQTQRPASWLSGGRGWGKGRAEVGVIRRQLLGTGWINKVPLHSARVINHMKHSVHARVCTCMCVCTRVYVCVHVCVAESLCGRAKTNITLQIDYTLKDKKKENI